MNDGPEIDGSLPGQEMEEESSEEEIRRESDSIVPSLLISSSETSSSISCPGSEPSISGPSFILPLLMELCYDL